MQYISFAYTDKGIHKETNQDAMTIVHAKCQLGNIVLAVLCDGMGGLTKGELASAHMVESLTRWFQNELPIVLNNTQDLSAIQKSMKSCILQNAQKIYAYGEEHNIRLGTTLTTLFILDDKFLCFHIGDTRMYILDEHITQITKDHSLVYELMEHHQLTKEQIRFDKRRNILTRCIGGMQNVNIEMYSGIVKKDNVFLLCCDGLIHEIAEDELSGVLRPYKLNDSNDMHKRSKFLVDLARQRGEEDNISLLLIKAVREDG